MKKGQLDLLQWWDLGFRYSDDNQVLLEAAPWYCGQWQSLSIDRDYDQSHPTLPEYRI